MSGFSYTTLSLTVTDTDYTLVSVDAINDSFGLVGLFGDSTASGYYAYQDGDYTTIAGGDGTTLEPEFINDSGVVAGDNEVAPFPDGFIYNDGTATILTGPDNGAMNVNVSGINASGTVTGEYNLGSTQVGFIYDGSYTSLMGPDLDDVGVIPNAINSSGEVVGQIVVGGTTTTDEGFIYQDGTYTLVAAPADGDNDLAFTGVNDTGEITVSYLNGDDDTEADIYDNGTFTAITGPDQGDTNVYIAYISSTGELAGYYIDPNHNQIAFAYNNGTYSMVSGPIEGDSFVSLYDINASGQIEGTAEYDDATIPFTATPLCFLRGTRILTPSGERPVEALAIGDAVVTRFGGIRKIKWIGRQSYESRFVKESPEALPVCIHPGALGDEGPARKLFVSPGHSLLMGDTLVLASTLVNGITVTQRYDDETPVVIDYFQIELESHDCIIAEGVWAETYADAPGLRAQFHNEAEYYALYPDEPPPEALALCAPRPERGAKLEAALRPVAARAAALVTPGRFEGWVETISDWRITGWAIDHDHPELPVLLEVMVGEAVIGTVLACEMRPDLAQAGIGNGRHAFVFVPAAKLRAAGWPELELRRASDGAKLQMAASCQESLAAIRKPALMLAAA
jgi:hypothetical protein